MLETLDPSLQDGVVLICSDPDAGRRLARALQRVLGPVSLETSLDPLEGRPEALIAVRYEGLDEAGRAALKALAPERPVLLLVDPQASQDALGDLMEGRAAHVLAAGEAGPDAADLLATARKLADGEIFGLEKYLHWGAELSELRLRGSAERPEALEVVEAHALRLGIPSRLRALLCTVTDEFLTNAFYHAPTGPDRSRPFSARPRTESVALEDGLEVVLRWGCDGSRFGLSAADPYGSLEHVTVAKALARGFRGEYNLDAVGGGAGLGLYHVLNSLTHLVINLKPGCCTEMIGLIDVSGAYRRFAQAGRSFNFFIQEGLR